MGPVDIVVLHARTYDPPIQLQKCTRTQADVHMNVTDNKVHP